MPAIRLTPRLEILVKYSSSSEAIGRPIVIKTNPVLRCYDEERAAISFPNRDRTYGKIPIYLNPSSKYVTKSGDLTPKGEWGAAFSVANYLTYYNGFRRSDVKRLEINEENFKRLNFKAASALRAVLERCFSDVFNIGSDLVTNNILTDFDFDPAKEHYKERFEQLAGAIGKRFSDMTVALFGAQIGLDIKKHPEVGRILFFDGIALLARLYLFLPQDDREVLLSTVESFYAKQLADLMEHTELDHDYHYLMGQEFQDYYTNETHRETQGKIFGFICGTGTYVKPKWDGIDAICRSITEEGDEAFKKCDFQGAFNKYTSAVEYADMSERIKKAMRVMLRSAINMPAVKDEEGAKKEVVSQLVTANYLDAAIAFQEYAYREDADLDGTFTRDYD
jgi:hypothetical protein